MRRLIFQGTVNESEINKIKTGMDIDPIIAALEPERFKAKLDFIAPKGISKDGSMQFEIRASLSARNGKTLRAGYSANAEIVIAQALKVLAIQERDLLFEGDKTLVEVEIQPGRFEKREVILGLSDGIHIEVKSGLTAADRIKVQSLKKKFL
jgi:HlyD family secretion protein